VGATRDLDHHRTAERLSAPDSEDCTRLDLPLSQVSQHRGIAVGDADEDGLLSWLQVDEGQGVVVTDRQVAIRNRVAVRVEVRLTQLRRDQFLQLLRDVMLEDLGLRVHPVPGHVQHLREEQLEQAVVPDHLQGDPLALRGEACAVIGRVLDQALIRKTAEHSRGRGPGDAKSLGDGAGADRLVSTALQLIERLGVVLSTLVRAPFRMRVVGDGGHAHI
jgi:hypothetical protein